MGLVKHLLFWPVTGPLAAVDFSMKQIEGLVQRELTDDERIREDLMALQMELELELVDEEEYDRREAEIMERFREARAWRTHFGMEEPWAPLGFTGGEQEREAEPDQESDEQSDAEPGRAP
ncbi:MAG TPA: gas vesicle protein GvpG [Longimicrobiales bacterium]|nr:gas vesicle protein GvpG [Longimicrobiales bacterium]